jgi:hypothetical protein
LIYRTDKHCLARLRIANGLFAHETKPGVMVAFVLVAIGDTTNKIEGAGGLGGWRGGHVIESLHKEVTWKQGWTRPFFSGDYCLGRRISHSATDVSIPFEIREIHAAIRKSFCGIVHSYQMDSDMQSRSSAEILNYESYTSVDSSVVYCDGLEYLRGAIDT